MTSLRLTNSYYIDHYINTDTELVKRLGPLSSDMSTLMLISGHLKNEFGHEMCVMKWSE